jgi:hypothetical protein
MFNYLISESSGLSKLRQTIIKTWHNDAFPSLRSPPATHTNIIRRIQARISWKFLSEGGLAAEVKLLKTEIKRRKYIFEA